MFPLLYSRQTAPRTVLHCDMNSCYASIEQALHPELKGKPIAVCGSTEERHGIVLAKSQEAKAFGVRTGEANWEAKQKCPDLIIVRPTYGKYIEYSAATHRMYLQYTQLVEPFGLDECWLDVTGTERMFGTGEDIAQALREQIKRELDITLSIGVSYNKMFAKLGSDYKKPDAQTLISPENYRDVVWPLPVEDLFGVGPATKRKLRKYGIFTIGDIATSEVDFMRRLMGINGVKLHDYANGRDASPVMTYDYQPPIKSVGHGSTFKRDLVDIDEIERAVLHLSQEVSRRLIKYELAGTAVTLWVKDEDFEHCHFHTRLSYPTQNAQEIASAVTPLFLAGYSWEKNVRSLTIRAEDLMRSKDCYQLDAFSDYRQHAKHESIGQTIYELRERYGEKSITYASIHNFQIQ